MPSDKRTRNVYGDEYTHSYTHTSHTKKATAVKHIRIVQRVKLIRLKKGKTNIVSV